MSASIANQHLKMLLLRKTRVDEQVRKFRDDEEAAIQASDNKDARRKLYEAQQARAGFEVPLTPLVRAQTTGPAAPRVPRSEKAAFEAAVRAHARTGAHERSKRRRASAAAAAVASNPFVDAVDADEGSEAVLQRQIKRARAVAAGSVAGRATAPAAALMATHAKRTALKNNLSVLLRNDAPAQQAAASLKGIYEKAVRPELTKKRGRRAKNVEVERRKRGDDSD